MQVWLLTTELKRQVLVKRSGCFLGSQHFKKIIWWTSIPPKTPPKCPSEPDGLKGNFLMTSGNYMLNWQFINGSRADLLEYSRLCACTLSREWNVLVCGFKGTPGELSETQKELVRGQHMKQRGFTCSASYKME